MKQKHLKRLSIENTHLMDIFVDKHYIEIGNVHDQKLSRLLNNKIILLDDIVDYSIHSVGLGSSKLTDEKTRRYLPFINILNIHNKDESLQLFLTYGIYYGKKNDRQEFFAPIILIPVLLYNDDYNFYVRMLSKPIENSILVNYLKEQGIHINKEKIDDIFSFDRYLNQFTKNGGQIRLESYFTFAKTEELPVVINHEKFSLRNDFEKNLDSRYYVNDESEANIITKLNNRQRAAVLRAKSGSSFAINGLKGTGKTTTLINIASDAIYNNKKVLYLSNKKESIDFVEREFEKNNLKFLVNNLTKSPKYRFSNYKEIKTEVYDEKLVKDNLLRLYKEVNNYEKFLGGRIRNFRFIDVVNELINLKPASDEFKCDDIKELYKFEFEEIIYSLRQIEEAMKKISFKTSIFTSIPINNSVKYPNQVSNLIFQIHKLFVQLNEINKELQSKYGFIEIENYARFKNYISDVISLDVNKVPKLWRNPKNFEIATKLFPQLKSLIYSLQEYELYIDWDYKNVESIDIYKMIKSLIGDYFTEEDGYKVDRIISSSKTLVNKAKTGIQNYRLLSKKIENIKKILDWDFDDDDIKTYEEITKLADFLDNSIYHKSWLNIENSENILNELKQISTDLNKHILLSKQYSKYFSNQKDINENISYIEKLISEDKQPKKFKNINLNDLLNDTIIYRDLRNKTASLNRRHKELTGFEYSLAYDTTIDFKKFITYITQIKDLVAKEKVLAFLNTVNDDDLEVYIHDLVDFKRSYLIFKEVYEYTCTVLYKEKSHQVSEQVRLLSHFLKYVNQVSRVCTEMSLVLKDPSKKLSLDLFIKLKNQLNQLNRIKKELNNNTHYPHYFGSLFKHSKTNIGEVNNIINAFDSYIKCFQSTEAIASSLKLVNFENLCKVMNDASKIVVEINESFKLYNKIFKDGIGNYYYDNLENVIKYLDKLNNAKEELKAYLELTEQLRVIEGHKLFVLSEYIINSNSTSLVENFKYTYFKTLYDIYTNGFNVSSEVISNNLVEIVNEENKLIKINIQKLNYYRSVASGENDSAKNLTLASTSILNYLLDYTQFDLILIDDSHVSNSNEFFNAINGKQVIIAGDNTSVTSSGTNLIAKMRPKNVMNLYYRYKPTPLNLLNYIPKTHGIYLNNPEDNIGYEITNKEALSIIVDLLLKNREVEINYFVPTIVKKLSFIEKLSQQLINNGFSAEEIFRIITKQLNIVDLFTGYAYDASYNIVDLDDYYNVSNEFLEIKYISRLITAQKKLYIIDKQNFISNDNDVLFIHMLKQVFSNNNFINKKIQDVALKLSKRLSELDIKVFGDLYQFTLVLERNNTLYNVLLFVNPNKNRIDLLEDYREYYLASKAKNMNVLYIWLIDLYENMDKVIDYINKETLS